MKRKPMALLGLGLALSCFASVSLSSADADPTSPSSPASILPLSGEIPPLDSLELTESGWSLSESPPTAEDEQTKVWTSDNKELVISYLPSDLYLELVTAYGEAGEPQELRLLEGWAYAWTTPDGSQVVLRQPSPGDDFAFAVGSFGLELEELLELLNKIKTRA